MVHWPVEERVTPACFMASTAAAGESASDELMPCGCAKVFSVTQGHFLANHFLHTKQPIWSCLKDLVSKQFSAIWDCLVCQRFWNLPRKSSSAITDFQQKVTSKPRCCHSAIHARYNGLLTLSLHIGVWSGLQHEAWIPFSGVNLRPNQKAVGYPYNTMPPLHQWAHLAGQGQ